MHIAHFCTTLYRMSIFNSRNDMKKKPMLILYHNLQFANYTTVDFPLFLFEVRSRVKQRGHFVVKFTTNVDAYLVHNDIFFSLVNMNDGLKYVFRFERISSDFPFDFTKCFQYKVQPPTRCMPDKLSNSVHCCAVSLIQIDEGLLLSH